MSYRLKLLLLFTSTVAIFAILNTGYSALNTISRLDVVEAQRDQWQRPAEVVQAMVINRGDVVADIGCGSGYFSLKLARAAAKNGRVYAEDIRRLPLIFLWLRTIQKSERNVTVVHGDSTNPHLPMGVVNQVLIANTYHELTDSQTILAHVRQALVSGGRLVVLDRAPNPADSGAALGEHEISPEQVETQLREAKFEISARQDHFIERDPDNERWWLIVARKP